MNENKAKAKESIVSVFMQGAYKGLMSAIKGMLPAVLMAYVIIEILTATGILNIIGAWFDPVMALFGMPGEAITVIITAFMTRPAGMATALSLMESGLIDANDVTVLVISIMLIGGVIQQYVRVVVASEVGNKYRIPILVVTVFMTFASIWLVRPIISILGL